MLAPCCLAQDCVVVVVLLRLVGQWQRLNVVGVLLMMINIFFTDCGSSTNHDSRPMVFSPGMVNHATATTKKHERSDTRLTAAVEESAGAPLKKTGEMKAVSHHAKRMLPNLIPRMKKQTVAPPSTIDA